LNLGVGRFSRIGEAKMCSCGNIIPNMGMLRKGFHN
jgi:hypothetical protein